MQLSAFSDDSDPLFGPAVWKYRDAYAQAAERASRGSPNENETRIFD